MSTKWKPVRRIEFLRSFQTSTKKGLMHAHQPGDRWVERIDVVRGGTRTVRYAYAAGDGSTSLTLRRVEVLSVDGKIFRKTYDYRGAPVDGVAFEE